MTRVHLRTFSCPWRGQDRRFDTREVERFTADHDCAHISCHFDTREPPTLVIAVVVSGRPPLSDEPSKSPRAPVSAEPAEPSKPELPPHPSLTPAQQTLRDTLQRWRRERAESDGVAAYHVLTNRELDSIVVIQPTRTGVLAAIDEIGAA